MAVHKSDQITGLDAVPANLPKANELHGRLRVAYFSFTTPTGGVAINDTVTLVRLPKGARIVGGKYAHGAMSSGAGAATLSIGVAGDATRYLGATDVDAAGAGELANTVALNLGDERTAETDVIATATVEAWAAAQTLKGVIHYAVD